ncbi:MAG: EAL domain-containing protein [Devosia sp.]|nr:EAL domain-containing protein [Devosia sp.]
MTALASVLATFVVTATLLAGFLIWTAVRIDEEALERQRGRVAHVIDAQLEALPREQQSVAIWDDTLIAIRGGDQDWLSVNVGAWDFSYFGHDETYIILGVDTIAHAWAGGASQPGTEYVRRTRALAPMLADLRDRTRVGYADEPPHLADYVLLDGRPAIASIMPVVSDSGRLHDDPGTEPLLVSISWLDLDLELKLMDQYLLEVGRFTTTAAHPEMPILPVTNRSGRIVAFYEWFPYQPGGQLLSAAAPGLVAAVAVFGLVLLVLMQSLWLSSRELEGQQREVERQATEDPLTGLPNRPSFEARFERLLEADHLDRPVALMMLDLDRFKQVNDTLGHHAGDTLIAAVGQRLRTVSGGASILARLGGDEFAILLRNCADEAALLALAQRIIDAIAQPFHIEGVDAFVGVSIGIVIAGARDRDRRELTRKADIALYEAKAAGRNRACFYEASMDEALQGRHTIEAELREALTGSDQLWVAYQPLLGRDRATLGAEALIRWTHPRLGYVSPANFVPVAETSGLIEPLGQFVLRSACELGASWPGRFIAVNISPVQLRNPSFADYLLGLLEQTGMRPHDLEIEITEGILLDDETTAAMAIRRLRDAGVRIALDDFGTGYSSLNYLKRYPVDRIKVDRSFISQLQHAGASAAIVEAMVRLAHALGIMVTAEGVETAEQHRLLLGMGCDTFQGFLFSPPLAASEIATVFAAVPEAPARVA